MTISQFPIPAGGIPTGDTAGRPANPVIGDVYYNGELGILEIFDGTNFIPCSAPAAAPTLAVADVGTSVAYGSAQGTVTITEGTSGGPVNSFLISTSTGGYSATTTGTTVTITVGNNGSYTFSGQGVNNFGTSIPGQSTLATLTTVPQAPTIGTATASTSANEITVSWTLGSDGGKNLSSITITPYLNGTTAQTSQTAATTSSTSYVFTSGQITGGSSYTFKVKVANANGDSLESSASNSATMPNAMTVDYLVVAGGGGGGDEYYGGGGGGGGYRCTVTATGGGGSLESSLSLTIGVNHSVEVGAGGPRQAGNRGGTGGVSIFSTITSSGGGGGGAFGQNGAGASGGSGGGGNGGNATKTGGAGTANQGYAGGNGATAGNGYAVGGGGGGASAVGANADGAANSGKGAAGNGGNGVATSITGSSNTYGGGGGGGNGDNSGTPGGTAGTGGTGGGGRGGLVNPDTDPVEGTVNTGGGGGGAGGYSENSKAGGSGIVILRYSDARTITFGAGVTGTESAASGGYKRATITAGSGNVSWS